MIRIISFLIAFLLSSSVYADVIMRVTYKPGFELYPKHYNILFYANGDVWAVAKDVENEAVETYKLGTLAAYSLEKITAKIASVDWAGKLVDLNANDPFCTCTPKISTYLFQQDQAKEIHRSFDCHEWILEDRWDLKLIIDIGHAYLNLAKQNHNKE